MCMMCLKYRIIYTIILLKSVCRCSQTAGRNSCSIVSGDVSNCSYRLTVYPVTSSRLSSVKYFFYTRKTSINYREGSVSRKFLLNEKGRNAGLAGDRSTVFGKNTAVNGVIAATD